MGGVFAGSRSNASQAPPHLDAPSVKKSDYSAQPASASSARAWCCLRGHLPGLGESDEVAVDSAHTEGP